MKVDFHEEIKEPIYAFTIKNLQGIEITGTNTMYEKADVKGKKEGESQEITFTQKLDLQSKGRHTVRKQDSSARQRYCFHEEPAGTRRSLWSNIPY